jgi:hypothetical protein
MTPTTLAENPRKKGKKRTEKKVVSPSVLASLLW